MACDPVPAVTELAAPSLVVRGCIAFAVWWVFAVFPAIPFLPIGRTAGSLLGATLMVVLEVISPNEAFGAIDLAILALLFGTMVVSEYLKRADLFEYLGHALSWKTRGAMDLLCRVCLLAALSSALFTNDTTCVVLTPFVLELCRDMMLHPKPFLLALACSSNIGSAATAIGNPQNLVIAVSSGISFGRFLAGEIAAVAIGLAVNTLLLVVVYGRSLSGYQWPAVEEDHGDGHVKVTIVWNPSTGNSRMLDQSEALSRKNATEIAVSSGALSPDTDEATPSHDADEAGPHGADVEVVVDQPEGRTQIPQDGTSCQHSTKESEISSNDAPISERGRRQSEAEVDVENLPGISFSAVSGDGSDSVGRGSASVRKRSARHVLEVLAVKGDRRDGDDRSVAKRGGGTFKAFIHRIVHKNERAAMLTRRLKALRETWRQYKDRVWKSCVYLVTLGMLAALLAGLSLPWTALTAAVVMMVLDFSDAGPSLDKVNYALLVFFCGMFIATSGFNLAGVPAVFWSSVEPHSQIGTASGVIVLSVVITVLSNVVSNVPTVILLGTKVAASAVASGASSDKAWLILAWVSTVAGNLTLLGSAANIIVAEQARETQAEKDGRGKLWKSVRATYDLTFWKHLKFGFPSTVLVIAVGLIPIALRKF